MSQRKRVIILGGGFGGVYTALALERLGKRIKNLEVLLVSQENFMLFTPMLHEVAAGDLNPNDIVAPLHSVLQRTNIFCGAIDEIDTKNRTVTVSHGASHHVHVEPYDHLVVALGSVTGFHGNTELSKHALGMKSLSDAVGLRNRIIRLFEEANFECCADIRRALLSFAVAGGGFAGVETVAAIHDFAHAILPQYRNITAADISVSLISSAPVLLPELAQSLGEYAGKLLEERGVQILRGVKVSAYDGELLTLSDGVTRAVRTVVWTAGTMAHPLIGKFDIEKVNGRIAVQQSLRSATDPCIWALGDCAAIPTGTPGAFYPPTAQHATREAQVVAYNIIAAIEGQALRKFSFQMLGQLASLGHRRGVAQICGFRFSGTLAWMLWRSIYLCKLPQWRRKIRVAVGWTLELFFKPDIVQLPLES